MNLYRRHIVERIIRKGEPKKTKHKIISDEELYEKFRKITKDAKYSERKTAREREREMNRI